MIKAFRILNAVATGLLLMCVAGCASSPPSKFYQLNSLKTETSTVKDDSLGERITVAVGPLRIPDYLDRPQIVTLSGRNELKLAEFDRWAGSLEKDIVRALTEDVAALLPPGRFYVMPWMSASQAASPSVYRVEVNVVRFEGTPGESVLLKVQWAVFHKEKGMLLRRESTIKEETSGKTYGAFVSAMSKALEGLSREIAQALL